MKASLKLVKSGLPQSTDENPFAQIDYVFNRRKKLVVSDGTAGTYDDTIRVFKEYLGDVTVGEDHAVAASLNEAFAWDAHFYFYKWLVAQNGRYSLLTIRMHLVRLKQVIIYARSHNYIRHEVYFVTPKIGNSAPTTDHRTAFDEKLYGPVRDFLEKEFRAIKTNLAHNVVIPPDLPGRDPRIKNPTSRIRERTAVSGNNFVRALNRVRLMGDEGISAASFETRPDLVFDDRMSAPVAKRALDFWAERGVLERRKSCSGYRCFFVKEPTEKMLRDADPKSYGWKNLDNLIWYIYNVLGGEIPEMTILIGGRGGKTLPNPDLEREFVQGIAKVGGIRKVKSLLTEQGLTYKDDKRVSSVKLGTLMAMLAMTTALNPESISSLAVDCIKEEPVSGKPCLQYIKKRSTGKKTLALFGDEDEDIYSDSPSVKDGTDSMLFFSLLPNADRVQDIVETIFRVTEDIRKKAPPEVAKMLFIFQQRDSDKRGKIVPGFGHNLLGPWSVQFKKELAVYLKKRAAKQGVPPDDLLGKEREIDELISTSSINIAKFRSSLATELALAGASIEIIQAVLGHRSRLTTKAYLERHRLEIAYHQEVSDALDRIKNGRKLHLVHCEDEDDLSDRVAKGAVSDVDDGYIFETGTPLFCRNPYEPSDNIKADIRGWEDGKSVCHRWNKCLFCDKVVIVDLALPKLIAYHKKLKLDLSGGMDMTPGKFELLEKTIAVIDEIIDPEGDFFDAKTIADARTRAESFSAQEADRYFNEGVGAWC